MQIACQLINVLKVDWVACKNEYTRTVLAKPTFACEQLVARHNISLAQHHDNRYKTSTLAVELVPESTILSICFEVSTCMSVHEDADQVTYLILVPASIARGLCYV